MLLDLLLLSKTSGEAVSSLKIMTSTGISVIDESTETRLLGPGILGCLSGLSERLLLLYFSESLRSCLRLCLCLCLCLCLLCFFLDFPRFSPLLVVSVTEIRLFLSTLKRGEPLERSSLSKVSTDTVWEELLDEMVTVPIVLGSKFPAWPGDESGDQLVTSIRNTGESLFQSVSDKSNRDTPDGPGAGVCQPT